MWDSQITRKLDAGDIQDVLTNLSGWDGFSQETQKKYYLDLVDYVGGREINPFAETMLDFAIRKWRAKTMATLTITSYLMPEEINQISDSLKMWTRTQKEKIAEKKTLLAMRAAAEALMSQVPDFKWGKNETEREAQFRTAEPGIAKQLDDVEAQIQDATAQIALLHIDVDRFVMLIDFFMTGPIEVNG